MTNARDAATTGADVVARVEKTIPELSAVEF
jgi:hypothetical protein